jgi:hypothetical protein
MPVEVTRCDVRGDGRTLGRLHGSVFSEGAVGLNGVPMGMFRLRNAMITNVMYHAWLYPNDARAKLPLLVDVHE